MVKYLGTSGTGIPPETRVTFDSLEEYVAYQNDSVRGTLNDLTGHLETIRAVDDQYGEYAPVYTERETSKRGVERDVARGGEWQGGRELNASEKAKLKKLGVK
jgi:hypothetical protein